ncbi:hypothetical protein CLF_111847 [Clonorchis sinensis]|uniref:Uncharacterized protein n=1 Tax=Clonorchis sinensis TaxID=79923 RepID=G7YVE8_CLOSI|nr:hypothetical protein CLF_111847 [Clonorchis sinensis]
MDRANKIAFRIQGDTFLYRFHDAFQTALDCTKARATRSNRLVVFSVFQKNRRTADLQSFSEARIVPFIPLFRFVQFFCASFMENSGGLASYGEFNGHLGGYHKSGPIAYHSDAADISKDLPSDAGSEESFSNSPHSCMSAAFDEDFPVNGDEEVQTPCVSPTLDALRNISTVVKLSPKPPSSNPILDLPKSDHFNFVAKSLSDAVLRPCQYTLDKRYDESIPVRTLRRSMRENSKLNGDKCALLDKKMTLGSRPFTQIRRLENIVPCPISPLPRITSYSSSSGSLIGHINGLSFEPNGFIMSDSLSFANGICDRPSDVLKVFHDYVMCDWSVCLLSNKRLTSIWVFLYVHITFQRLKRSVESKTTTQLGLNSYESTYLITGNHNNIRARNLPQQGTQSMVKTVFEYIRVTVYWVVSRYDEQVTSIGMFTGYSHRRCQTNRTELTIRGQSFSQISFSSVNGLDDFPSEITVVNSLSSMHIGGDADDTEKVPKSAPAFLCSSQPACSSNCDAADLSNQIEEVEVRSGTSDTGESNVSGTDGLRKHKHSKRSRRNRSTIKRTNAQSVGVKNEPPKSGSLESTKEHEDQMVKKNEGVQEESILNESNNTDLNNEATLINRKLTTANVRLPVTPNQSLSANKVSASPSFRPTNLPPGDRRRFGNFNRPSAPLLNQQPISAFIAKQRYVFGIGYCCFTDVMQSMMMMMNSRIQKAMRSHMSRWTAESFYRHFYQYSRQTFLVCLRYSGTVPFQKSVRVISMPNPVPQNSVNSFREPANQIRIVQRIPRTCSHLSDVIGVPDPSNDDPVVTRSPRMSDVRGSNPGTATGYALLMSSNKSETRVQCFPLVRTHRNNYARTGGRPFKREWCEYEHSVWLSFLTSAFDNPPMGVFFDPIFCDIALISSRSYTPSIFKVTSVCDELFDNYRIRFCLRTCQLSRSSVKQKKLWLTSGGSVQPHYVPADEDAAYALLNGVYTTGLKSQLQILSILLRLVMAQIKPQSKSHKIVKTPFPGHRSLRQLRDKNQYKSCFVYAETAFDQWSENNLVVLLTFGCDQNEVRQRNIGAEHWCVIDVGEDDDYPTSNWFSEWYSAHIKSVLIIHGQTKPLYKIRCQLFPFSFNSVINEITRRTLEDFRTRSVPIVAGENFVDLGKADIIVPLFKVESKDGIPVNPPALGRRLCEKWRLMDVSDVDVISFFPDCLTERLEV